MPTQQQPALDNQANIPNKQTNKQTNNETNKQTSRQANAQPTKLTNKQARKQTNKQTNHKQSFTSPTCLFGCPNLQQRDEEKRSRELQDPLVVLLVWLDAYNQHHQQGGKK
jgi:hypothetical protein